MIADGPSLSCGPGGNIIIAFRHFVSGRKIHAYNKVGDMLYEICLDEPKYKLESRSSYVSVGIDGMLLNFLYRMRIRLLSLQVTYVTSWSLPIIPELFCSTARPGPMSIPSSCLPTTTP